MKSIWEELNEYKPVHHCHYGGVQALLDHFHFEYVLTFLLGLNESYSQIRDQILTMDPFPSIQCVFSLVIQEEKQREVGNLTPLDSQLACDVQGSQNAKSGKKRRITLSAHTVICLDILRTSVSSSLDILQATRNTRVQFTLLLKLKESLQTL